MLKQKATTALLLLSLLLPATALAQSTKKVTSSITGDVTWTADTEYLLRDFIFIEDGATLTIEPGTVIRGTQNGDNDNTSALIVARGGRIQAQGTPANPIIFTSENDNLDNPGDDLSIGRGAWGGVLILGNAPVAVDSDVNASADGDQFQIEGIPQDERRAQYGGTDAGDDSGVFRYVSIRHGGAVLGADNEINGLSMGGVGTGTTIENVEVIYNLDDGYEWFGGTVNTKHLVAAFCGDDAFDVDQGFQGRGQFWFAIQNGSGAGRGGEFDGPEPADNRPLSKPVIQNATLIGPGSDAQNDQGVFFRRNAAGELRNSVVTAFNAAGVNVQDRPNIDANDSRARLEAGDLAVTNNVWFDFGNGNSGLSAVAPDYTDSFDKDGDGKDEDVEISQDFFRTYLGANANSVEDPKLRGLDRDLDDSDGEDDAGGAYLDPRPAEGSPVFTNAMASYDDDFFTEVDYIGAFGNENWAAGWTALSTLGFLTPETGTDVTPLPGPTPETLTLEGNYPDPVRSQTTIAFELGETQRARLEVFNVMGRRVAMLLDRVKPAGAYEAHFDASDLPAGTYFYRLRAGTTAITETMTLVK